MSEPGLPIEIWLAVCNYLHYDPSKVLSIRLRRDGIRVVHESHTGDLLIARHRYRP